ncbi:hypothetical protein PSN01_04829 [Micromonospora saelicesensis]|nr:hypothetical protein PSN01_04829 [Micromonospora saelicesensis]
MATSTASGTSQAIAAPAASSRNTRRGGATGAGSGAASTRGGGQACRTKSAATMIPPITATSHTTPSAAPSPVVVPPDVCQIRSASTEASSRTEPGVITRIRSNVRLVPTATKAKTTAVVRSSSGRHCASHSTWRRVPP